MNMHQKREMRKNKKMNEDKKSLPSTGINCDVRKNGNHLENIEI